MVTIVTVCMTAWITSKSFNVTSNQQLGGNQIFQKDNDPKLKWIKQANINHLELASTRLDLNPIENLWTMLKT